MLQKNKKEVVAYIRPFYSLLILFVSFFVGCSSGRKSGQTEERSIEQLAANKEVARKLREVKGRGALKDSSKATPAKKALKQFTVADDLTMRLVTTLAQPLDISFDLKGRMWVVQYKQFPYPAGLKITNVDNHMRFQYDKVPKPPPEGVKGADKIIIFTDTNGDGTYDQSTDAITGLNIATSVARGRGRIWVLNPPYLLAYPDGDGDGIPDGEPTVALQGFGLEDTHSVANSLRWGPDGWLYGSSGSTTKANVSSAVTKNVKFNGQAIWRYNPATTVFEIYAEGGGNSFNVEIDSKGRVLSGYNGYGRGPYFKQGAYYRKNWGKHGALTNPYAFGILPMMKLKGEKVRFTHALIRYDGGQLPQRYEHQFLALNPLQGYIVLTDIKQEGSTLRNIDRDKIVSTDDRWFRPVDVQQGPDGNVYIADWYDSRLSHVDPHDTWSKTTGRIYRLENKKHSSNQEPNHGSFDLSTYSNDQLIGLLHHKNRWYRRKALQIFADRKDSSVIPKLTNILQSDTGQGALEALWAIHLSGGFDDNMALMGLTHENPYVRMWAARLVGDDKKASERVGKALAQLCAQETNAEVRSQLAATAKRLPGPIALPMIRNLLVHHDDSRDPDIPMQIWWAVESKAESDRSEVLSLFQSKKIWNHPVIKNIVLERLMKRYILAGGNANYNSAATLLSLAPSKKYGKTLMQGLQEGLRGQGYSELPKKLLTLMKPYETKTKAGKLVMALRQGKPGALDKVLKVIVDNDANLEERLSLIRLLGTIKRPKSVPVLLSLVTSGPVGAQNIQYPDAVKIVALRALMQYPNKEIGKKVVQAYPFQLRAHSDVRLASLTLLVSRAAWAQDLLYAIDKTLTIHSDDVPTRLADKMKLLGDDTLTKKVNNIWPETKPLTSEEKSARINEIKKIVQSGSGDKKSGHLIYRSACGSCHTLFGEGGVIGPDLTGYDRRNLNYFILNIVNPDARIREGFETHKIMTKTGRLLVGNLTSRNKRNVTIQTFSGDEVTLSRNEIDSIQVLNQSLMPEGLLRNLSDQQVRDLFAYIQKKSNL